MRVYLLILCLSCTSPTFAIYDLASINITPRPQGTEFCFLLDSYEKEMYLALTLNETEFFFLSPTSTGELSYTLWQFPTEPPVFFTGKVRPVCYGPFLTEDLQGIQLYAGVGDSFNDLIEKQQYLKIFGNLPNLTKEEKLWTIMIYMVGSSLERQTITKGYASKDILEMLIGTQIPENRNINVVITTGGSSREGWKTVKRSLIRDRQLFVLEDLGEQPMNHPQTLSDFVLWAKDQFPAQHYALVLWNHGGGTQGFGQDTSKNVNAPMMSLIELHQAYQAIRAELEKPLEIIIYDACVMASIEVSEITATVANVMSGSVEIEPEHGINYTHFLNNLATTLPTDGITLGQIVKEGYIQQTKDKGTFNTSQITYSILDLTQLPPLRETLSQFATELQNVFTDSSFLTTEMLSRGIIQAPGYPAKFTGKLPSLDRGKDGSQNIRIDFYNVLQTVSPEFPQLKSDAEALQTILRQLVVDYETNDKVKAIDPEAGRISIDIGSEKGYLSALPSAYTELSDVLNYYNQKRKDDTSSIEEKFTCPDGKICADAKWLNLQADKVIAIDGYYGQQVEESVAVYLIKPIYRYQTLEKSLEIGVNGYEACQYQLCVSDTECSDLTVTENNGLRLADVVYNEIPAILTLCPDDNKANWTACSVLPQQEGIWGRDEPLSAGDTVTPTVLHLQNGELTQQSSQSLTVGDSVPVIKSVCDTQKAVITASYFGNNYKPQLTLLCDKGDCICKENDKNESCLSTANQSRAGVRITTD